MADSHASDLYDAVNTWGLDDEFFLRFAASFPAARVEWIVGDSTMIPPDHEFDAAIMSANVAQAILDDVKLSRSFMDIAAHLAPGGRLAFDSRDPLARGWDAWTKERSHKIVQLPEGQSHHWYQTTHVDEAKGLVEFCAHEIGVDGNENVECDTLRFRSEEQLRTMLREAGLVVDEVFGGFAGEPVGQGIGSLVITAHKANGAVSRRPTKRPAFSGS